MATGFKMFGAALLLARAGLIKVNALSLVTATGMKVVTAAQWALNVAMRANPIGLVVTGLAALASATVVLAKHWQPLGAFFNKLWTGIKTATTNSIDWMRSKIHALTQPLQLLGKLWRKITALFHHNKPLSSIGQLVQAAPSSHTTVKALPSRIAANTNHHQQHSVNIHSPITIHAQPGMDEQAIAAEVQKALQQHAQDVQSQQRAALYDETG